jgi:N-acetyl-gamma-glutamylphosphate reductase
MASPSILTICIAAFVLIFLLLSVLSIMMRGLTLLFPLAEKEDSATIAAIHAAYHSVYPDSKVTRIEETTK